MLSMRDQENLVHAHQTTAAGKPLNQGIRSLQPKTPGNLKTPFRAAKNDENKPLGFKNLGPGGNGKLDKNAFVTPMGPRARAPLGMKTTNAKGQAFQTPAPPQQTLKPEKTAKRLSTGRRSAKSKITVAPSEPVGINFLETVEDEDVPEVEYAPPTPVDLPDHPEEFGYDQTFPQFQGLNMTRGYGEVYGSPKDDNGISLRLKREEEDWAKYDENLNQQILRSVEAWPTTTNQDLERQVEAMIAAGPKNKRVESSKVNTVKAKSAAAALSHPQLPSAATKTTASSLQKKKKPAFAVLGSKTAPESTNSSSMRHNAAVAISKNTIGHPKAKKAPSIIPRNEQRSTTSSKSEASSKIDQSKIHPEKFVELYGEPPVESEMWLRLREHQLLEDKFKIDGEDDLADDLFETNFFPTGGEEDDELFQLAMPE